MHSRRPAPISSTRSRFERTRSPQLAAYLLNSTPRWSGTYDAMAAYAARAPKAENARLRFMDGYAAYDRADTRSRAKDYDGALTENDHAAALVEHWLFLVERARIERHQRPLDGYGRARCRDSCPAA